jgi:threonine/homoserine/homoserine lactone efflux protein
MGDGSVEVALLRGVAIGFAIAAPIGPVGILCIRKALADGRLAAIVAGLGAALADAIFGAVVGLGLTAVSEFLAAHSIAFKLAGGAFMMILGVRTWRAAAIAVEARDGAGPGMVRDFFSTFVITITNPATILGVMGVFAAIGTSSRPTNLAQAWMLVGGIFLGSVLWWLVLSTLASAARASLTPDRMRMFNHVSAMVLIGFAVVVLGSLVIPGFF